MAAMATPSGYGGASGYGGWPAGAAGASGYGAGATGASGYGTATGAGGYGTAGGASGYGAMAAPGGFACEMCYYPFTEKGYQMPRVLPACGHTLCHSCVTILLTPPSAASQPSSSSSSSPSTSSSATTQPASQAGYSPYAGTNRCPIPSCLQPLPAAKPATSSAPAAPLATTGLPPSAADCCPPCHLIIEWLHKYEGDLLICGECQLQPAAHQCVTCRSSLCMMCWASVHAPRVMQSHVATMLSRVSHRLAAAFQGRSVQVIGGPGAGPGKFSNDLGAPWADPARDLLFVPEERKGIAEFKLSTGAFVRLKASGMGGNEFGQFSTCHSPLFDAERDWLMVPDHGTHKVMVLNYLDLKYVTHWGGSYSDADWAFSNPTYSAYDPVRKRLYTCHGPSRVSVISTVTGEALFTIGNSGTADSRFWVCGGVAVDPIRDLLYVSDRDNKRIQVFRAGDGSFVSKFGNVGDSTVSSMSNPMNFMRPGPLACDPATDTLFVNDSGRIKLIRGSTGTFIRYLIPERPPGTPSPPAGSTGQLSDPSGLFWEPVQRRLYVSECGSHRVQVFA